jgi:CRISPR-associated protein Csx14
MAEAAIPVDLFNPGQVFACLGFVETAEILFGDAEAAFDWQEPAARFCIRSSGADNPIASVLAWLSKAIVRSQAPTSSTNRTERWQVPTLLLPEQKPFPFPDPASPATLPAVLLGEDGKMLTIDHWGDATSRDNVKFWAGLGGAPGCALLRDALDLVRGRLNEAAADPFSIAAPQRSSFRFDWRRDYVPMDVGFSPNDHSDITMVGFPLVEIMAAIGLMNARPARLDRLSYRYAVIGGAPPNTMFSPMFLRAGLGAASLPFPRRVFRMRLDWPGQEGQARCITDIFEEERP